MLARYVIIHNIYLGIVLTYCTAVEVQFNLLYIMKTHLKSMC